MISECRHRNGIFLKKSALFFVMCTAFWVLAHAQITLSYGSFDNSLFSGPETSVNSNVSYIELGYQFPLSNGVKLVPRVGLVKQQDSGIIRLTEPSGLTLGFWSQYDFLTDKVTNAYAQGGLTYLDYEQVADGDLENSSEFQFALGVGADVNLGERIRAFTNLNYVFSGETPSSLLKLDTRGAGLEIGIELSF